MVKGGLWDTLVLVHRHNILVVLLLDLDTNLKIQGVVIGLKSSMTIVGS